MAFKDIITTIIAVLAFIISVSSFIMSHKKAKAEALIAYLKDADSVTMRERRTKLYESEDILKQDNYQKNIIKYYKERTVEPFVNVIDIKILEQNITDEIAFYDKWALLTNRHYLPRWAIGGNRATVFLHVYEIVKFYIDFRQKENKDYASDMTKLYNKLKIKS